MGDSPAYTPNPCAGVYGRGCPGWVRYCIGPTLRPGFAPGLRALAHYKGGGKHHGGWLLAFDHVEEDLDHAV